jgi:hypothetical protein
MYTIPLGRVSGGVEGPVQVGADITEHSMLGPRVGGSVQAFVIQGHFVQEEVYNNPVLEIATNDGG